MSKRYVYFLLFCFLYVLSCVEAEEPFVFEEEAMNLHNLNPGDTFSFVFYTAENYRDPSKFDVKYTGDTLLVEILSTRQNGYFVKESITRGSRMFSGPADDYYWFYRDSVYINFWEVTPDSLIITSTLSDSQQVTTPRILSEFISHLFYSYKIPLVDNSGLEEVEIKGWKTTHPYYEGNKLVQTSSYKLFDTEYTDLTIFLNNAPMSYDAPGRTTVYSRFEGIVKSNIYSWWSQQGQGWDRLK